MKFISSNNILDMLHIQRYQECHCVGKSQWIKNISYVLNADNPSSLIEGIMRAENPPDI
jgi:hypothetical protein